MPIYVYFYVRYRDAHMGMLLAGAKSYDGCWKYVYLEEVATIRLKDTISPVVVTKQLFNENKHLI